MNRPTNKQRKEKKNASIQVKLVDLSWLLNLIQISNIVPQLGFTNQL